MWNVITRGFEIAKASVRVLRRHPRLLVFPVLAALVAFGPLPLIAGIAKHTGALDPRGHVVAFIALMAPSIFFLSVASTFFTVAFVRSVLLALRDEPLDLVGALRFAASRLPTLVVYGALNATVGLLFSVLEKLTGRVGGWITRAVFGFSWSVATFLVVPVLVQEHRDALPSLRRSNELVKDTFGERVVAEVGTAALVVVPAILGGLAVSAARQLWHVHLGLSLALLSGGITVLLGTTALLMAVRTLFSVALYQLAVEGIAPQEFDAAIADVVWRTR